LALRWACGVAIGGASFMGKISGWMGSIEWSQDQVAEPAGRLLGMDES
jgi:hypothetical protein